MFLIISKIYLFLFRTHVKYLEGKNSIGAFYYYDNSLRNDSIRIEKVSSFNFDKLSWMLVSNVSFFGGLHFDHTDIITKMLTSGEYKCA